ncbi:MAG: sigma 54-interacting transcriptional regulator [Deltaproteobacteria bacterium]|nr:sigma 54-interacting transcriptional regulator [Deltaproteobacteria bacterium]
MSAKGVEEKAGPGRGTVLVVDDDESLLRLITLRLQTAGYTVVGADSGEKALNQLAACRPDLVITDLRMEGMNGLELFEAIRRVNAVLPVILLTAHGSIPDAVNATKKGIFSFLTKPFDGKDLLAEVERAVTLGGGSGDAAGTPEGSWKQGIITRSPLMEDLLSRLLLAAQSDANVLLRGDSGTGKELLARALHEASPRRGHPFVGVNCGAIPEGLLESELFGHARGAFTGAVQGHEGLFQSAHGGTLLLDEIGDMPLSLQVKLLRVIQERQVRPVGSARPLDVDVRIVTATHRDLDEEIARGAFREDLYYRINVVSFDIPTLAERREDIPLLAAQFLAAAASRNRKDVTGFAPEAMEVLLSAPWPGNVRQLQNVVEQSVALATTPIVSTDLVRNALRTGAEEILSFDQARGRFEREYLVRLLQMTEGNVTNAARLADRNRTDFYKLLRRHQIDPSLFKPVAD